MTQTLPMTLINGQADTQLAVQDRGLAYGDGLFETIQVRFGQPLLLDAHLCRLKEGAQRLKIPLAPLEEAIDAEITQLCAYAGSWPKAVLKLTITRGSGGRGYYPDPGLQPTRILSIAPAPDRSAQAISGIAVHLCETRLACNPLLAGIKHLNRLEQVLARGEWHGSTCAEGLVCDTQGYLVEGTMSNLCWITENTLYTPDLHQSGVAGVVCAALKTLADRLNLSVRSGRYLPQALCSADEVFVCNSLINIWPVIRCDALDAHWPIGPHTQALQALLEQEYSSQCA